MDEPGEQYNDDEVNMSRVGKELAAGGFAGTAGILLGLPFDLIKVRMQVNPEMYVSGMQCFMQTVKADGFLSLYRGMMAPVLSQMPINAILFASEEACMRVLEPNVPKSEQKNWSHILAGSFAGLVQCGVLVPFDRVKCLVQADASGGPGTPRKYSGTIDCAVQVFNEGGIRGFYKGFVATALREVPSLGVYFTTYKWASLQFQRLEEDYEWISPTFGTVMAGGAAGGMSWLTVYPFDVIKTRIQTMPATETDVGIVSVGRKLYAEYGAKVFFRGLSTTMARAFPVNGMTFLVYEKLKILFEL
jgi:solute carrier family 25 carnitine/acylcarnitine transporter 20/29